MKPRIDLITIFTENIGPMVRFYRDVVGFEPLEPLDENNLMYVEFQSEGVRFAVCARSVMRGTVDHASFSDPTSGQAFELAFPLDSPEEVDAAYADLVAKGATPIQAAANMPWNQRTAFFADPDGNIHELFANLPESG
jgi:lactoylglutathione lyase